MRIVDDTLQDRLKRIARIAGAFAIVEIFQGAAARGPCEQQWNHVGARIVHDLREPIDGLLEPCIVTMDEDQHVAVVGFRDSPVEFDAPLFQFHAIGAHRDEIARGIAGRRGRPLHLADLSRAIRRNRPAMSANDSPIARSPST